MHMIMSTAMNNIVPFRRNYSFYRNFSDVQWMQSVLTDPDKLAEYVNWYFGVTGPHPVPETNEEAHEVSVRTHLSTCFSLPEPEPASSSIEEHQSIVAHRELVERCLINGMSSNDVPTFAVFKDSPIPLTCDEVVYSSEFDRGIYPDSLDQAIERLYPADWAAIQLKFHQKPSGPSVSLYHAGEHDLKCLKYHPSSDTFTEASIGHHSWIINGYCYDGESEWSVEVDSHSDVLEWLKKHGDDPELSHISAPCCYIEQQFTAASFDAYLKYVSSARVRLYERVSKMTILKNRLIGFAYAIRRVLFPDHGYDFEDPKFILVDLFQELAWCIKHRARGSIFRNYPWLHHTWWNPVRRYKSWRFQSRNRLTPQKQFEVLFERSIPR